MPADCPPPRGFREPWAIAWALPSASPPTAHRPKPTGLRAKGISYEQNAHRYLAKRFGKRYLPSPWFSFSCAGERRWCQPDGLLIDLQGGKITVIEIKYQHTPDAWWQLTKLYLPVLSAAFGSQWRFSRCEVVKWFDKSVEFPESPVLTHSIENISPSEFGIHIWKPRL